MQEYLIRHHDYIGLLMADLVNIIEVDAIENPSHYCGCFWRTGSYTRVFTIERCPSYGDGEKLCSQSVMKRNVLENTVTSKY